jgi:hypothetical protein
VSAVLTPPLFAGIVNWQPAALFKYPAQASTTLYGKRNESIKLNFSHPCCQLTDSFTLNILPKPNPDFTPKGPFCASSAYNLLSGVTMGGYFKGLGIDSATSVFDATHPAIAPGLNLPSRVAITHIVNPGCQNDTTIWVDVYHPFDTVLAAPNAICLHDDTLRFKTRHTGGRWSGPGTQTSGLFDPKSAGVGVHSIRVDSVGFCGNAASFPVTVNPHPLVNIKTNRVLCPKESSVTLDAQNPGATYKWNNGVLQQKLYVFTAGIYWVKVTDVNGCATTDTTRVEQKDVCVGIAEEGAGLQINIFPNPFRRQLYLSDLPLGAEIQVTLLDLSGRELLRNNIPAHTDSYTLHAGPLASGVYLLRIESAGKSLQYRVVKE